MAFYIILTFYFYNKNQNKIMNLSHNSQCQIKVQNNPQSNKIIKKYKYPIISRKPNQKQLFKKTQKFNIPQNYIPKIITSQNYPSQNTKNIISSQFQINIPQNTHSNILLEDQYYNLQHNLDLIIKSKYKTIKLSSKNTQKIPFMINLKLKDILQNQQKKRIPVNLICVIDISGSMNGQKLVLVQKTLINLIQFLLPKDKLCLIAFNSKAYKITQLIQVSDQNKNKFIKKISKLNASSGTNIAAGMSQAFKIIKNIKNLNSLASIFLLTDGIDDCADKKIKNQLHYIQLNINFSINCFGFGSQHDENLLLNISKIKDGNFYFIQQLKSIDQTFAEALGQVMSVVAFDVNINIRNICKNLPKIQIKQTFGDMWNDINNMNYNIKIPHLHSGIQKGFVGILEIPKTSVVVSDKQRSICVLQIDLTALNSNKKIKINKKANLILNLINQNQQIGEIQQDGQVMQNYFRVKGASAIQNALIHSNNGQYQKGKKQIRTIVQQINFNNKICKQRLRPIISRLIQSQKRCQKNIHSDIDRKSMLTYTHEMMQQKNGSVKIESIVSNKMQTRMIQIIKSKRIDEIQ